jgi:TPR repeat protein
MVRPKSLGTWTCVALAIGSIGLIPAAWAANDTARFNGKWRASFPYNGQTVTIISIHDARGFKNYTLVPNGAVAAGAGTFSAADGRWTAASAPPNNTGTYHFTNDNTVICTNAVGQTVVWQRDDSPLPPVAPTDQELMAKYRKAADAGDADAMNSIGLMYDNGQGVPRDAQQAMVWYRKAAAGGNSNAALQLGFDYGTGHGVPIDYQQAMAWYRKAAAEGNTAAMRNIGILYWDGRGVPMDHNLAVYWCRKAAAGGDERSQEWLRENGVSESTPGAPPATRR